jgi:hypothetical protein
MHFDKFANQLHITFKVYDVSSRQPGGWKCAGAMAWERGSGGNEVAEATG